MSGLTGQEFKEWFKQDPNEVGEALSSMMHGLYPHATAKLIKKEINSQLAGAKPCNLGYARWIQKYLREGIE